VTPKEYSGPNPDKIHSLFTSIAEGYDRANDAMTWGFARHWRKQLVYWSGINPGQSVLDCATGTGDLAFAFKRAVGSQGLVVGTDFCEAMLNRAPEKAQSLNLPVEFSVADAMNLPFENNTFEVVSMAYGIRNVEDPRKALEEMARVCRPGGRVMILETGDAPAGLMNAIVRTYFRFVVPAVGGVITGNRQAYQYLVNSSGQFPSGERFLSLLKSTKQFSDCQCRSLMGGASYMYRAVVRI